MIKISVRSMIDKFGVEFSVYRKSESNSGILGYEDSDFSFVGKEKILLKKPAGVWLSTNESGVKNDREEVNYICIKETIIKKHDRIVNDSQKYMVLRVSNVNEYSVLSLDRGD